jgi:hypothetical protein
MEPPRISFIVGAIVMAFCLCGCSSPSKTSAQAEGVAALENVILQAHQVQERLIRENQELRAQVGERQSEVERLKENAATLTNRITALKAEQEQKNAVITTLTNWFELSNAIAEHRAEIVSTLQSEWEPRKQNLFASAGGKGEVQELQVEDVFFYRGFVVIPMLFFWTFDDGSGAVGRATVALDPAREFHIASCEMVDQLALSREDLMALQNGSPVEQKSAALTKNAGAWSLNISEDTKNRLWQGGIAIGVAAITKLLSQ